jgi:hypothetical protein
MTDNLLQLKVFSRRSAHRLLQTQHAITTHNIAHKSTFEQAFTENQLQVFQSARAHGLLTMLISFNRGIDVYINGGQTQIEIINVLSRLRDLFAMYWISRDLGEFLEASCFGLVEAELLRNELSRVMTELRPDAVGLGEFFFFYYYKKLTIQTSLLM